MQWFSYHTLRNPMMDIYTKIRGRVPGLNHMPKITCERQNQPLKCLKMLRFFPSLCVCSLIYSPSQKKWVMQFFITERILKKQ